MSRYAFHDLTLEVEGRRTEGGVELGRILDELSWERTSVSPVRPNLCLSVSRAEGQFRIPSTAGETFRADGFRCLETEDQLFLTDGASLLRLQFKKGKGEARLSPSFFLKPLLLRQNFWVFALLKLLRPLGIFGLHAAGVVARDGMGVLVVGTSGSGKSTLAIALVRRGWRYLSDDAVLLRSRPGGVEALALRRHFYVVGAEANDYTDVPLGEERPDQDGGTRRRVGVEAAYPELRVRACTPRVLLFPRLTRKRRSALLPLERADALGRLIGQSSPQLFDRATMASHLAVLGALLRQTAAYELAAGIDLREDASALPRLLAAAEGEGPCLASSSS